MAIVYSTREIHPRDRLSYWLEVATKAFAGHEFASSSGSSFTADIRSGLLAGLAVSAFECDPCGAYRTARHVARNSNDDFLLCLQVAGKGMFEQDGRQAVIEPDSFVLLDARRPYASVYPEHVQVITFKVPRQKLGSRLGNVETLTARSIAAQSSVGGLTSRFLSMLPSCIDTVDDAAAPRLAEQALDLIALAVSEEFGRSGAALSSARCTALFRLKAVIESRLNDPDLKPGAVAVGADISVRYANDLLSQEGFSIERYVLHRRLERCRSALEDRVQAHRKIGEIAFSWGFSDLSHFARRFREAYGFSPSDYRRRALEATAARGSGDGVAAKGGAT